MLKIFSWSDNICRKETELMFQLNDDKFCKNDFCAEMLTPFLSADAV